MEKNIKAYAFKPGTRQGCPCSPFLLNTVLEVLASAPREGKECDTIGDEIKISLSADDMILHIKKDKDYTRKLLELIKTFNKA